MYLSELQIRNFRQFGDAGESFHVRFNIGVTALVGQNDSGKSTVIDAIRYVLLTRDQESIRIQPEDFHVNENGQRATEIYLTCKMSELTTDDMGAFLEYLSYEDDKVTLYINWTARKLSDMPGSRRWVDVTMRSGRNGTGPAFDSQARALLAAAYLKPLRDAEREMAPGRNSRLSQVLANVSTIRDGSDYDQHNPPKDAAAVADLSLLGLFDYLGQSVQQHAGIRSAQETINDRYLPSLSLQQESLKGRIAFFAGGTDDAKLRHILERLELSLFDDLARGSKGRSGLGSNNLLFMACELLLLGNEPDGLALLLIEEPEAHLHPQRQLRLMEFLDAAASNISGKIGRQVQVVLTTHSPNLASKIQLENVVLLDRGRAFSFTPTETKLARSDYRFLQRFLDVTKANLFFAHGVLVVEGEAEALLIPTLAKLIDRDLTEHGVSVVNVGGTGLRRFSRILQRNESATHPITIPVACVTDLDVMPNCAPQILELVASDDDSKWSSSNRRWRALRDLGTTQEEIDRALASRRAKLSEDDGANVRTFVADHWTLEYDLAMHGLAEEVFVAARLAQNDDPLNEERKARDDIEQKAKEDFHDLQTRQPELESLCSEVYRMFAKGGASKAIAAQYLAESLLALREQEDFSEETVRAKLPNYLIEAIEHVTSHGIQVEVNQHNGEE